MLPLIPTDSFDQLHSSATDDKPRYFLDDAIDANTDADWWLDLGRVDLPCIPGV